MKVLSYSCFLIFALNSFAIDVDKCNQHLDGLWGNGIGRGFGFNTDGTIKFKKSKAQGFQNFNEVNKNKIGASWNNTTGKYSVVFSRDATNNSYSIVGTQSFTEVPFDKAVDKRLGAHDAWLAGKHHGMIDTEVEKTFKIVDGECVLDRVTKTFKGKNGKEMKVIELDMGLCQDLYNEIKKDKKLRHCLSDKVNKKFQQIFSKNLPMKDIKERWLSGFSLSSQDAVVERNVNDFKLPEVVRGFTILSHCRDLDADVFYSKNPGKIPFGIPKKKYKASHQ